MKQLYPLLLIVFTSLSQADVLTKNLTVNSNKIAIIENYSSEKKHGLIHVKLCNSCPVNALTLDAKSIFILDGKNQSAEKILHTGLTQPSKSVRIQYNHEDNSISYIRWNPVTEF
jgi:hypothetical protein